MFPGRVFRRHEGGGGGGTKQGKEREGGRDIKLK